MNNIKFNRLRKTIFIILILIAFIFALPLQIFVFTKAKESLKNFKQNLSQKIGIEFSYESISPSIFSNLNVKNVVISEVDGDELIRIERIKITYKIIPLLKKDFQKGLENIVIDGIRLDVSQLLNVIEKISSLNYQNLQKSQNKNEDNSKNQKSDKKIDFETIVNLIPQNVKVKNISLLYDDENLNASLSVRDIILKNNERAQNLDFQMFCRANANFFKVNQNVTGNLNLNGTIQKELDNSQIELKLENLTNGTYTLNKLNVLATYNQNVFDIHTIQSLTSVFLSAQFNEQSRDFSFKIEADNFKPSSVISSNKNQAIFQKIKNLVLNISSTFLYNFNSKEFDFSSNGNFSFPNELFSGGLNVLYDVDGNENKININKLSANGENFLANANLSLIYKNLQLSGFVELPYFYLPNQKEISTEIYFDPLEKGFLAFSPQLFIGEKSLTALQLKFLPEENSYDFSFEASDYSNASSGGEVGSFHLDGSYLSDSKYIQSSVTLNSLYAGSMIDFVSQVVNESNLQSISNITKDFMFSGDAYISTDFKSLTYNIPYIVFANTKKENQVLFLSANGNERQIQLEQLNLIYGKLAFGASCDVDINNETDDIFFTTDLLFENVPYHFSGTFMNKLLSVNGDYNTFIDVDFSTPKKIFGSVVFENFPIMFQNYAFNFSTQSAFLYDKYDGPNVNIERFEIDINDSKTSVVISPKILLAGNVTKYGAQFSTVTYSDLFSTLEGAADFRINLKESLFDSAGFTMNLKNPLSTENIFLEASVSNPDFVKLNTQNLRDNLYITVQTQINNFGLNRFTSTVSANNFLTGNIFASGTINHPYVALNVQKLSLQQGNNVMNVNTTATLEDNQIIVDSLNMTNGGMNLRDVSAKFSLESFTGSLNAFFHVEMSTGGLLKTLDAPLVLAIEDSQKVDGQFLPESFVATLKSEGISGTYLKKIIPLNFTLFYSPQMITLTSGSDFGLYATYLKSENYGEANLSVNTPNIIKINGRGTFSQEFNIFDLDEIEVDLEKLFEYINFDEWVIVENGIASGHISYTGTLKEPVLTGEVDVLKPEVRVPIIIPEKLTADFIPITIANNEIYVNKTTFNVKNKPTLDADCRIVLNGWSFDYLESYFKSVNNQRIYGKLTTPIFTMDSNMILDLYLYFAASEKLFELNGSINGENLYFETNITDIASSVSATPSGEPLNFVSTLNITTGTHAAITMEPIIRAVLAPNTKFILNIDNAASYYNVDGIFDVKSGDIAYLSRNFYIKSGSIDFNTETISNPKVTLNAETREKDDAGENVRIIFSVENQYLQQLSPHFSSIPAKSETEILSLLGQIVLADSDSASEFLFAAGGYALQSSVGRQIENKLRQLLNFDILSLRTNFIQNTLSSSFGRNSSSTANELSFGNLFDNSTVYIGKYLGSNLYIDAMLNVSYEERSLSDVQVTAGNLVFQPEVGLELESPFGNIRWNVAPDINALLNKQYVPSSSVTLSWKFTF